MIENKKQRLLEQNKRELYFSRLLEHNDIRVLDWFRKNGIKWARITVCTCAE